ncbi:uncharacterized protein G2W53_028296 [Senna tora]|uniref:Uncharacterized protein n=1 Tax=Senna tora TaxID=362788 RepID=A0A834W9M2_9FABA|nr:uncharacterized protein G2W53_028296 [Senna tora]
MQSKIADIDLVRASVRRRQKPLPETIVGRKLLQRGPFQSFFVVFVFFARRRDGENLRHEKSQLMEALVQFRFEIVVAKKWKNPENSHHSA